MDQTRQGEASSFSNYILFYGLITSRYYKAIFTLANVETEWMRHHFQDHNEFFSTFHPNRLASCILAVNRRESSGGFQSPKARTAMSGDVKSNPDLLQ